MKCAIPKCGKETNLITVTNIPLCSKHFDEYLKRNKGIRIYGLGND